MRHIPQLSPDQSTPFVVGLSSGVLESTRGTTRPDGIGTYTKEIERHLTRLGVSVRRIGAPIRSGMRLVHPTKAAPSFPLPLGWLTAASSACRIYTPGATRALAGIDIYHATDLLVPRLRATPVVATVYDAIPLATPQWANPRLRQIKNWLLRTGIRRADIVIAISEAAVPELIEHYGVARERIRVVPLGVDHAWFEHPDAATVDRVLQRYGLQRGYFLHVGTLQPRKNLEGLVTAYESLPATIRDRRQLVLVGKYGWAAEPLRERLAALHDAQRVRWLDYLPENELRALYAAAGAFVFPSLAEGFGLPVLEAMASGLRVIASDIPALREIATGHAEFIAAGNVDALAAALAGADAHEDTPAGSAARRAHARRYDWPLSAARTLRVYRELLPGRAIGNADPSTVDRTSFGQVLNPPIDQL